MALSPDTTVNDGDALFGMMLVGMAIATLALVIALVGQGDTIVEGVTGHDLEMGLIRCKPAGATFEQTLACTQAVYGGRTQ